MDANPTSDKADKALAPENGDSASSASSISNMENNNLKTSPQISLSSSMYDRENEHFHDAKPVYIYVDRDKHKWRVFFAGIMVVSLVIMGLHSDREFRSSLQRASDTMSRTVASATHAILSRTPLGSSKDHIEDEDEDETSADLPPSILDLDSDYKVRATHDIFEVPYSLARELVKQNMLDRLFTKLRDNQRMPNKAERRTRLLVVQVSNSLNNRLWAMGSALAYARNTMRVPVILWERDSFFYPRFRDVFRDREDLVVLEVERQKESPVWSPDLEDWAFLSWSHIDFVTFGNSPSLEKLLDPVYNLGKHMFIRTGQMLNSKYSPELSVRHALSKLEPKQVSINQVREMTNTLRFTTKDEEVTHGLHYQYQVPWLFLHSMSVNNRMDLLDQLSAMQKKIDAGNVTIASTKHARAFFVHCQYGLGNRMRALGSAMVFAQRTDRVLVVIWEKDFHVDGLFGDFFVNGFVVINSFAPQWPIKTDMAVRMDSSLQSLETFNLMRKENKKIRSAAEFHMRHKPNTHIYIKTAYVIKSAYTGSDSVKKARLSPVSKSMQLLTPVLPVKLLVARHFTNHLEKMVGVHIRARTIEKDIASVDPTKEYTSEASKMTNFWRKATSLPVFIEKMSSLTSSPNFFVATDTSEAIMEMEALFPGRIFHIPRRCDDRGATCMYFALSDIICLSKTRYILGSHWSSFTEAAVRLGGHGVLLAGVDFGVPRKKK